VEREAWGMGGRHGLGRLRDMVAESTA